MVTAAEFRKICWQSRRGMLELDVLLVPFCEDGLLQLSAADQRSYMKLLLRDDPQLLQWFSRQSTPEDQQLARIVDLILQRMQR